MKYLNELDTSMSKLQEEFQTKGFVKISNIFTVDFVDYIKEKVDKSINAPIDKYQTGFNRIAFDLFLNDPVVFGLMKDTNFRKLMAKITTKKLFFSQALAFELQKNKSTGFPWHIGTQSFGYQQAKDFGCTIWMPLEKIDTNDQRGGMAYVPENLISGDFMYEKIDPSIVKSIEDKESSGNKPKLEDYLGLRDGILNNDYMKTLLDHFSVEDNFEIGDVLLFNKNVIHSSVKLEEGEIESRGAFVMRFIDSMSTYDKDRAQSLDYPRQLFNYSGCTTFHLDVCKEDKSIISNSNYFTEKEARLISA